MSSKFVGVFFVIALAAFAQAIPMPQTEGGAAAATPAAVAPGGPFAPISTVYNSAVNAVNTAYTSAGKIAQNTLNGIRDYGNRVINTAQCTFTTCNTE